MNNNEKLFDLMSQMYSEMKNNFEKVYTKFNNVDGRLDKVEEKIDSLEKVVLKIEHDHGQKLEALFDGYIQNSEKLNRIEAEVSRHDKFIMTKIK